MFLMPGDRKSELLFKASIALGSVPFIPIVLHGYELAFTNSEYKPHPAHIICSGMMIIAFCMRFPYIRKSKLMRLQAITVISINFIIILLYSIAINR